MERITWIDDPACFVDDRLAEEWDRLAARSQAPFLRPAWFSCWWNAFGRSDELAICALWRDEALAGVLPLQRHGDRLTALANVHSPLFAPLASDVSALERVLQAAASESRELSLFGVPATDPSVEIMEGLGGDRRRRLINEEQHVSPIVDTRGDLDDYLRQQKGALREVSRRRRKMSRSYDLHVSALNAPVGWEPHLDRGLELEARGWKGRGGTAILSDPSTARFYRLVAETFARTGELALPSLTLDGALVAFDLALVAGRRYWLLKTAYDEAYSSLGPGQALRLSVIENCFKAGLEAHEFLGDDMPHKRRFATGARRHVGLWLYARDPRSTLRFVYRRDARPLLKRAYRRIRPITRAGTGEDR
jgi:CelD/BcsL family acetyltransferase involved in cellulose biosynthesis